MMFRKPTIFLILTAFSILSAFGASLPNLQNALALQPTVQLLAQSSSPGGPSVQLLTPANGATVAQGGTLFLSANVSDPDGVDFVDFLRNGAAIGRAARSSGDVNHYTLVWIATDAGTHSISVRAVDLLGNSATSGAVTITVGNNPTPTDTTLPVVQLIARANQSSIDLNSEVPFTVSATDSQSSIQSVEVLRNGSSIGSASSNGQANQYSLNWSANSVGQHTFTARASDSAGNSATSAAITITVIEPPDNEPPNVAPSVTITAPANNAEFVLGSISIVANASDSDGSVQKVEFFANDQSIGSRTPTSGQTSFSQNWNPLNAGTYTITARATDNDGAVTTSAPVQITVRTAEPGFLSAVRRLPETFRPGKPFSVEVEVTARGSAPWTLQEIPPTGWRVVGISHGGRYDAATGKITYRPNSKEHRTLKYRLISRSTDEGTYNFTGVLSSAGQTMAVTGDTQLTDEQTHKTKERVVKINRGKRGKSILRYTSNEGARWVVEFCDSISQKTWTTLPNATFTVSSDGEISIDDPDESAPLRFYRLRCVR